jgi:hypothetical protein
VTEKNYFQFDQQYYKQTEGLAMGAPTPAILPGKYILYMEHKNISNFNKISNNWMLKYVDNILID